MLAYFSSLSPIALLNSCPGGVAQGLIWGIMALGVYLTFRSPLSPGCWPD